jgi:quercetin dioxygenase-like cupin family protein
MKALLWVPLAAGLFAQEASPQPNTLSEEEKKAGWRLLFDGKTFDGWRGYKMDTVPPGWKVIDGAFVRVKGGAGGKGAGGGDDLITTEQFDNFELVLEWKIVEGGNSGILWRVTEDAETSWHTAPEMQVLDNAKYKGRNRAQLAGACYDLYAASKDVTRPAGEWNQVRVVADRNRIEHWLNGEKIVEYEIGSDDWNRRVAKSKFKTMAGFARAARGHVCLQDHSNEVRYRSIKIRPLPAAPDGRGGIRVVRPADLPWARQPAISRDADSFAQYGDPATGPHLLRLKFPAGTFRAAHYHTHDESVTVLSGTLRFGVGAQVDESKEVEVEAGGYLAIPGRAPHWIRTKTEVTLLVFVNGPRDTVFVEADGTPKK